jgi:parallel beta-helix repeat protein
MDDLDLGATIKGFSPGQKVFNRYTLKKILGRGGMGVVWLARDDELERDVALKFLPEVVAMDQQSLYELKRETRRSLELTHPHIVRIYDFVQDSRMAAISMEYVAGDTLAARKLAQPNRCFNAEQLGEWLGQLAGALDYAHHKAQVVHRDLKPSNLMIDARGDLKIADFGIAASVSDSVSRVSQQAGSSGTPVYMSPQQMMGEKPAVADDVYALGATLYDLLTGKPPFHSGNIMMQVINKAAPDLNERRQAAGAAPVSAVWAQTIAACLAKEPSGRPLKAGDVAARCHSVVSTVPDTVASPVTVVPALSPPAGSSKPEDPPVAAPAVPPTRFRHYVLRPMGRSLIWTLVLVIPVLAFADMNAAAGDLFIVSVVSVCGLWVSLFGVMFLAGLLRPAPWEKTVSKTQPDAQQTPKDRRWLHVAGVAMLGPALASYFWSYQSVKAGHAYMSELGFFLFWSLYAGMVWVAASLIYALPQGILRLCKLRNEWLWLGIMGGFGGLLGWLGFPHAIALRDELFLSGGQQAMAVVAAAALGASAGWISHRMLVKEPLTPGRRAWYVRGSVGCMLLVAGWFYGVTLPEYASEVDRRVAAREEQARKVEEITRRGEAARQEEARQVAIARRRAESVDLIREAHRMVFDRAPTESEIAGYTELLIKNMDWSPTRLREEIRVSPAGLNGGRLLVPEEFPTIGKALDAAKPGNAVHVAPGIYRETIYLAKAVNLIGAGHDQVTIEATHDSAVLNISNVPATVVCGFTFRHESEDESELRASLVHMSKSTVQFEDNAVLSANGNGLWIASGTNATIRNNEFRQNRWAGLVLNAGSVSIIADNTFDYNNYGILIGEGVTRAEISRNKLRGNQLQGIRILEGDNIILADNRVTDNARSGNYGGIYIGKGRPVLRGNVAQGNPGGGILWKQEANPRIQAGNISDDRELPLQ